MKIINGKEKDSYPKILLLVKISIENEDKENCFIKKGKTGNF